MLPTLGAACRLACGCAKRQALSLVQPRLGDKPSLVCWMGRGPDLCRPA